MSFAQIYFALEDAWSNSVRVDLESSTANRNQLDIALLKVDGKDREYLIAHASQCDLVNLTAEQITDNITYARRVHVALPYLGKILSEAMWREWVLPHRVLEEDVELWRKSFYNQMQPVVRGATTTKQAVEAIHNWLWTREPDGELKVKWGPFENRTKRMSQAFWRPLTTLRCN